MGPLGRVFEEYLYGHIVITDVTPPREGAGIGLTTKHGNSTWGSVI